MDANIYGHKLVKLPTPRYVIFYNGRENVPDETVLNLSDAFEQLQNDEEPTLECRARMLNINYGHNNELLNTCKRLHDYAYFIAEVNRNLDNKYSLKTAIDKAIDTCISKGILTDILIKCRSEVQSMLLTEYNPKKYRQLFIEEAQEIGLQQGREEGLQQGRTEGENHLNKLYAYLIKSNRIDDMQRAINDPEYRQQLFKEYESEQ